MQAVCGRGARTAGGTIESHAPSKVFNSVGAVVGVAVIARSRAFA